MPGKYHYTIQLKNTVSGKPKVTFEFLTPPITKHQLDNSKDYEEVERKTDSNFDALLVTAEGGIADKDVSSNTSGPITYNYKTFRWVEKNAIIVFIEYLIQDENSVELTPQTPVTVTDRQNGEKKKKGKIKDVQ